jgi:hypothetical protein
VTLDDVLADAARELDALIARHLWDLELRVRRDCLVTGPESEEELDRVADPSASWRRASPEELVLAERERLHAWRDEQLTAMRRSLGGAPARDEEFSRKALR